MIFQLSLFSLLLLLLFLVTQFESTLNARGYGRREVSAKTIATVALESALTDSIRVYVLFAPLAMLSYLQGKPGLLPQYLAWGVLIVQVIRGSALATGRVLAARIAGVLIVAALFYLWLGQTPFLIPAPR